MTEDRSARNSDINPIETDLARSLTNHVQAAALEDAAVRLVELIRLADATESAAVEPDEAAGVEGAEETAGGTDQTAVTGSRSRPMSLSLPAAREMVAATASALRPKFPTPTTQSTQPR